MRKFSAVIVGIFLVLAALAVPAPASALAQAPATAVAEPPTLVSVSETVEVSCDISGADIYADGAFTERITDKAAPVQVSATSSGAIRLELPGYTASYQYAEGAVQASLVPEFYPAAYEDKVTTITVDNSSVTLEAALNTVKNRADEFHHFTIDGGSGVTLPVTMFLYASNARFVGLTFDGQNSTTGGLGLRGADENNDKAYHSENLYFLGCTFTGFSATGVGNCGKRGYAGTDYDTAGTLNYTNLCYSGCHFNGARLFSFAGAGDEDYNVIDGYKICGNTFTDCGIGMLSADAHSWYVFGYDGLQGYTKPAVCEYNILKNVLISGNSITMTENTVYEYESIISVGCSNLGNQNNLTEQVVIRNNKSRITGGTKNLSSAITLTNVSVSDNYSEAGSSMDDYAQYMVPGLTHTDGNTLRHVQIYNNDFQLGGGRLQQ